MMVKNLKAMTVILTSTLCHQYLDQARFLGHLAQAKSCSSFYKEGNQKKHLPFFVKFKLIFNSVRTNYGL